jgi:hypothetical protein
VTLITVMDNTHTIYLKEWLLYLVDSSHPPGVHAGKGSTVRRLKWYVSWVQYSPINRTTNNLLQAVRYNLYSTTEN